MPSVFAKEIQAGDSIHLPGNRTVEVEFVKNCDGKDGGTVQFIVGGPFGKVGQALMILLKNDESFLVHPSDVIDIQ